MARNKTKQGKQGRRQGAEFRAAGWVARHPGSVLAPGAVITAVNEFGSVTTGSIAAGSVAACLGWARAHPSTYDRYAASAMRAWRHRWIRYFGFRWQNICRACDLVKEDRRTGAELMPRILRVSSPTPTIDRIKVRMVRGQSLRTWQEWQDELAAALNVESLGITKVKPQVIMLTLVHRNPFPEPIPATPVPDSADEVNLGKVVFGQTEYGEDWTENLLERHVLGIGSSGSGKSGLMWNPLRGIGPLIRDGLVRIWMVDLKGGMETSRARPLFYRFADHVAGKTGESYMDFDDDEDEDGENRGQSGPVGEDALTLIKAFRDEMKTVQTGLAQEGKRKFELSPATPVNLLIIDEMAMATALGVSARDLTKIITEIMTQGRAPGYWVWAFLQEPTKDILPMRDLFNLRVCLSVESASYVDMALGEEARVRGALADEIPIDPEYTGIGFTRDDRSRNPVRVRAGHTTDEDIDELVRTCTPQAALEPNVLRLPVAA
ncbi:hypothetical protein [Sciscionella marina]|uniref:hypothetical protein n=1 Tax=Sciscionella marina TaxID=508770 RepID=UPI00036BF61A|nr:hypothetical protein [Sciscionella marina]